MLLLLQLAVGLPALSLYPSEAETAPCQLLLNLTRAT